MYIESLAWATNLKQKMVCGSVLIALRMEYWEVRGCGCVCVWGGGGMWGKADEHAWSVWAACRCVRQRSTPTHPPTHVRPAPCCCPSGGPPR